MKLATKLLSALIQDVKIFESFEEILTAGGADKLVLLVLKHISLAIACRETETKVALRADTFLFLVSTSKYGGFPSAHLSQKIIAALVSALDALLPTAIQLTWPAIYRGIGTLMAYLPMGPAREVVEAELLRFIVSCAVKYTRGPQIEGTNLYEELGWIMKTIAESLVSCSVVTAIHSALKEVQSSLEMDEFAQVPVFSVWTTLATLVEQRARVLNSWKSAGSPWLAAWNNMTYGKIKAWRDLKRCAHCRSAYYCSSNCQQADWGAWRPFHRRERAFMHALIDADYKKRRIMTHQTRISCISTTNGVKATVPELFTWYRNRRLQVVFIAFELGPTSQYIPPAPPPPHSSSAKEQHGFQCRIVEEIPAEADESWVENKMRELVQSAEVVEIH
ncbi:hypothetical protein B0H13DRAFT_2331106 [Mycena leptocephala]|nr:hypothetical protein B0H13DRAFT_2331106 [Mycena leptocephala]